MAQVLGTRTTTDVTAGAGRKKDWTKKIAYAFPEVYPFTVFMDQLGVEEVKDPEFNSFYQDREGTWLVVNGFSRLTMQGEQDLITVTIIKECTAINVFGVVAGLIIPLRYSSSWNKIKAITLSGALLFMMNISRIMLTVYLTGYSVPPFSWYFQNPTVETYHYPISFAYGVIGVALLILIVNKWVLPELGDTLLGISLTISDLPNMIKDRKETVGS